MLDNKIKKIKDCFNNKALLIKSINNIGTVEYKPIIDVFEHITVLKDIYKVTFENNKSVIVTEDHSLYTFQSNEIKKVKPIESNNFICIINNNSKLLNATIEKIDSKQYMYDLSVKDNQNFVLASQIVVSNSFSPPSSEQEIAGFTETRGYKWPDDQLANHLEDASNYINLWPPATEYELMSFPAAWEPLMLMEAQVYALYDLAILWAGEEFNYSLAGVSLDIRRSDKYSGLANQMQSTIDKQLEMAKKRVKCIVGLRQDRYTYSRGASLGPWCIRACSRVRDTNLNQDITIEEAYNKKMTHSLSMDLATNKLFVNDVMAIWSNGKQDLYKIKLSKDYEIECTKTHKFFYDDNSEVMLQDLDLNEKIWVKNNKNVLKLAKIIDIDYSGKFETYDLQMRPSYCNYIANNIVVHNTSGQSIKRWTGSRFNRIQMG
jgi:hypothetical protein